MSLAPAMVATIDFAKEQLDRLERENAALREAARAFLGRLDRSPYRASEMADWDELFDLNHASNLNPPPVKDSSERTFKVIGVDEGRGDKTVEVHGRYVNGCYIIDKMIEREPKPHAAGNGDAP